MQLAGNTVLITGGGTGIGRGLAEAFVAAGSEVIIAGRRESVLRELAMQHERMHYIGLDVADPLAIGPFAKRLARQFPRLNVLVNNAGIMRREDWTADRLRADAAATLPLLLLLPGDGGGDEQEDEGEGEEGKKRRRGLLLLEG